LKSELAGAVLPPLRRFAFQFFRNEQREREVFPAYGTPIEYRRSAQ